MTRVVFKFGGDGLSSIKRVKKAAEFVKKSKFKEKGVVVSAMGKTTDALVDHLSKLKVNEQDYADILGMGERTSVRIFYAALKSTGVKSTYFDPQQERWPIITDSQFENAKPFMLETKMRVRNNLEPLLEECIPVVCGFLGKMD